MVVVINGTNGIVAPGLTSQDSTGTSTLTTSSTATIGGPLTVNDSASITGALTAASAAITGALTADSASITGGISIASLTLNGTAITATATELNRLTGVTSNIQPQINAITLTPNVITANTTAEAGNFYYLDSAGITLTLPATPSTGDLVGVSEVAGDNTHIIARNGSNIMSDSADLTFDIAFANFVLTYTGPSVGWAFSG
jgi:hypothetical protein